MSDQTQNPEQLAITSASDSSTTTNTLDVTQPSTVKLDSLGPMVVNSDGTLSRIQNWQSMTEAERERTLRVLGKRNVLRQEKLKLEDLGTKS